MNSCFRLGVFSLVIGLGMSASALAAQNGPTMEQRLQRIERMLQNQSLADLVLQIQQLQQEVQQLRGDVELQKHTMDAMSRRQRDLYLDIDQRLSRVQTGGAAAAPPVSAPTAPPVPEQTPAVGQPTNQPSVAVDAPSAPVTPPDPKKEEMVYQEAFNLLKQGRYPESITAFTAFLKDYSGGSYEDNAQYWLAEASYVNRDFDTALAEFSKVQQKYAQSPKVPGAMLKMGYIYYEKQNWSEAKKILTDLQLNYPATTEARLAQKRIQRMKKEGR